MITLWTYSINGIWISKNNDAVMCQILVNKFCKINRNITIWPIVVLVYEVKLNKEKNQSNSLYI
jgi:hypothetical protein